MQKGSEGACMHDGESARGVQAALVSQLAPRLAQVN